MIDWYPPDEAVPGELPSDRHPPSTTPLPSSGSHMCGCVKETCLELSAELGWSSADRVTLGRAPESRLAEAVSSAPEGDAVLRVAEAWCALRHPVGGRAAAAPSLALAAMRQRFGRGAEAAIIRALGRQLALRAEMPDTVIAQRA